LRGFLRKVAWNEMLGGSGMYGETTAAFISHLKANGPQTAKQLEAFSFWGGVRTRIGVLVKQGRVVKVSVANPEAARYSRAVVVAYKAAEDAEEGPVARGRRRDGETYDERVRREKKERAVARAIALLEQQGYKVLPPNV